MTTETPKIGRDWFILALAVIGLVLLILAGFLAYKANAVSYLDTTPYINTSYTGNGYTCYQINATSPESVGTFKKLKLYMNQNNFQVGLEIRASSTASWSNIFYTNYAYSNYATGTDSNGFFYDFDISSLNSGSGLILSSGNQLQIYDNVQSSASVKAINYDIFSDGFYISNDAIYGFSCSNGENPTNGAPVDLAFKLYNPYTSPVVNLDYPTSTTTQDFTDFMLDYNFNDYSSATDSPRTFYVDWGNSTSSWDHTDYINEIPISGTSSETGIVVPKSAVVPINIQQYARARLSLNGVPIATSSIISWESTSSSIYENHNIVPPSSTTSTNTAFSTENCDPNSGLFSYGWCYVMTFLFVPSNDVLDKFSNLKDTLIAKPPLGYFSQIQGVMANIATSSSPFTLAIDYTSTTSPFYVARTGLSWIIWFIFGFWIFHRFRLFNFF